jgi:hypothetical protein
MIRRPFCAALVFSALTGVVTLSAGVASAADDDAAAIESARQRFQEGVRYFDAKQYDKARAAFLQAYALKKHPTVLLNLAQSELRSAHDAEAADHFSEFLRENKDASAAERQSAEAGLTTAKARVAEVSLAVDLPDAEVFVDNVSRGHAPLPGPVYLAPGTHSLQARKEGKLATSTVTASAGQSVSVALNFSTSSRPPEAARTAPPVGNKPPPEPRSAGLDAGGAATAAPESEGKQGFGAWYVESPGAWILTGVAVVGLGGGGVLAYSARANYKDADTVANDIKTYADERGISTVGLCVDTASKVPADRLAAFLDACKKYDDNVKRGDLMKTLATVGFAVGGAAVVGTVVYYFVDRDTESSSARSDRTRERAWVAPLVAPGFVGVAASATF